MPAKKNPGQKPKKRKADDPTKRTKRVQTRGRGRGGREVDTAGDVPFCALTLAPF